MEQALKVTWMDGRREPKCPPDPRYPKGKDIDAAMGAPSCETELPYPAKRCGYFAIECPVCGMTAAVTTAGRPDDPRSVKIPCRFVGGKQ